LKYQGIGFKDNGVLEDSNRFERNQEISEDWRDIRRYIRRRRNL